MHNEWRCNTPNSLYGVLANSADLDHVPHGYQRDV